MVNDEMLAPADGPASSSASPCRYVVVSASFWVSGPCPQAGPPLLAPCRFCVVLFSILLVLFSVLLVLFSVLLVLFSVLFSVQRPCLRPLTVCFVVLLVLFSVLLFLQRPLRRRRPLPSASASASSSAPSTFPQ